MILQETGNRWGVALSAVTPSANRTSATSRTTGKMRRRMTTMMIHLKKVEYCMDKNWFVFKFWDIIQICSGITHGRLLSGELYAQRLQLIRLHLSTDCFMKISLQLMGKFAVKWLSKFVPLIVEKIVMKQSVDKCRQINFCKILEICVSFEITIVTLVL